MRKAALEAADEAPFTMKSMPGRKPDVLLVNFGDSSLDFHLLVRVANQERKNESRYKGKIFKNRIGRLWSDLLFDLPPGISVALRLGLARR